jgi:Holliday junction resolvase-like predicted endonuclease
MTVEKHVVFSLLRLTLNGPVHRDAVSKYTRVPAQLADQELERLLQKGFFYESKGVIEASPADRVKLALHALSLGADFQKMCELLSWKEFEDIAAKAFEANGYSVLSNFRFRHASRRWEIDLIGLRKPLILCVDCKHWKRGWRQSATSNAVQSQIKRTEAFSKSLHSHNKEVGVEGWKTVVLVPVIMSLTNGPYKVYDDVPVVPVLQLQDFINELPAHVHLLKRFNQKIDVERQNLASFCKKETETA